MAPSITQSHTKTIKLVPLMSNTQNNMKNNIDPNQVNADLKALAEEKRNMEQWIEAELKAQHEEDMALERWIETELKAHHEEELKEQQRIEEQLKAYHEKRRGNNK